jgi:glycerol-3-phosphate dehydrogenase (NAD(P)+)
MDNPSALMPKVAVIGSGSWATAIVKMLCENPIEINWWIRKPEVVDHVQEFGHNPNYLSDVLINLNKVKPSSDLKAVIASADFVVMALPSAFINHSLQEATADWFDGKVVFSAVKGLIPESHQTLSQYFQEKFGLKPEQTGIIAGPCHSEEVAMERQSYLTVASYNEKNAYKMGHLLNGRFIHTHFLSDVIGIEMATVMKNIFSLAVGITKGLNYGDNFQAVMVSNAMQEMKLFLDAYAPSNNRDLNESAYLGDLLVTAYSPFSRNRVFGQMIGKGYTVKSAQFEMNMVAEGYYAINSIMALNEQLQLELPICKFVYNILYKYQSTGREIKQLEATLK